MRILQLGKFYPIRGGVEKVMWDITKGLADRDVPCDMLCAVLPDRRVDWKDAPMQRSIDGMLAFVMNKDNIVYCARALTKKYATMISPAMVRTLKKICNRYDIIHVHHPDPMACLALKMSGFKGKVVLHWHSDILSQKGLYRYYKPLQNWLIDRADMIVGTTPVYLDASECLKAVPPEKKMVIPIGVDPLPKDNNAFQTIRKKYTGKYIVFSLGRIVPYKGFDYLVEAAALLPDNYVVIIGGSGPGFAQLQEKIYTMGLHRKVEMLGYLADATVNDIFHSCHVFVLPSVMKTEAFGIVQIEAMSCGKPVVATKIPGSGVSWVNEDGVSGINVPCRDPAALALAIRDVCENKTSYPTYCTGARERYEKNFTTANMISKTLQVYEKVLSL